MSDGRERGEDVNTIGTGYLRFSWSDGLKRGNRRGRSIRGFEHILCAVCMLTSDSNDAGKTKALCESAVGWLPGSGGIRPYEGDCRCGKGSPMLCAIFSIALWPDQLGWWSKAKPAWARPRSSGMLPRRRRTQGFRVLSTGGSPTEARYAYAAVADLLTPSIHRPRGSACRQRTALERVLLLDGDGPPTNERIVATAFLSVMQHPELQYAGAGGYR